MLKGRDGKKECKRCSVQSKLDLRVESPRKLFRSLHDFLEEGSFEHEYEPLKAERDAIGDTAIFTSELVGKREMPGRNPLYLIAGIILLFTILLAPLAIRLLENSRYTLRTIARIGVEGEAYRARSGPRGVFQTETLDVVSDARVTLILRTGIAKDDNDISGPTRNKRELARISDELRNLKDCFDELMISMALPLFEPLKV